MKTIYRTPISWGEEEYFFTPASYPTYMKNMASCFDDAPAEPDIFSLNDEGFYESIYHKNYGREFVKILDWSDSENLIVEYK